MKKLLFTSLVAMFATSAFAVQRGDFAIGGNLLFGAGNNFSHAGVGAKVSYNITDPIRAVAEFDFFLRSSNSQWTDISLYGHYLFFVSDRVILFPAVGVGLLRQNTRFGSTNFVNNSFAFSLGGGIEYVLNNNFSLIGEYRLKLFDGFNRSNIVVGVAYRF